MSQVIANLLHRKPLGKKMSRTRVPKRMRPMMANRKLEWTHQVMNRFPDGGAAQRAVGSLQREKDMARRTVQPHFPQVTEDRVAYR